MANKISIIGAGSWGTTLAVYLAKKGVEVKLHSVFKQHNLDMAKAGKNQLFLKNVAFPAKLTIELCLQEALKQDVVLIAIPVKFIPKIIKKIKACKLDLKGKIFVSVSKGIEKSSLKRVSEIIQEQLKAVKVVVLSGPTIAKEVAKGLPSTAVAASKNKKAAKKIQELFNSTSFRVYLHADIVGIELAGALKNIIALGCGISDGLKFGCNTKSALVTRGLVEMVRLGKKMGANPETFWGIGGLGDLATTCFSPHSRNRMVGELIGQGQKLKKITAGMDMVAEGVETVKSAYNLSKKLKITMPITEQVYLVLYRKKSPSKAVIDLMCRPAKEEKVF